MRHRGHDLVPARHRRREIAVPEARDLDRSRRRLEQLASPEAVAHRSGADANGVRRNLEERVERDDLVHLAAADVHVVGDRVGQLHRDRSHLAANASEIVEQAGSLARKLRKQRCEPEHVHRRESIPRSAASGAPSSAPGAACCRVDAPSLPCPGVSQPGAAERRAPPGASATSRSTASSRFRDWLRSSCATARSTGPARATTRRFCVSVSAVDASTSNSASTRVDDFWAC